jgi:hypothetical protein
MSALKVFERENKVRRHRNSTLTQVTLTLSLFVVATLLLLTIGFSAEAEEGTPFPKFDYVQLERDYVKAAFGGKYVQLTKFNSVTPLTRSFRCDTIDHEKCMATISLFDYSVSESDLLRVKKIKGKGDLRLVLADKGRLRDWRTKLGLLYQNGTTPNQNQNSVIDNSSADCQLYVWVAGSVITSAVIVISVDAEPLRAQTCFIANFARSLGLSLNDGRSFADAWGDESSPKSGLTSDYYEELKYRVNVMLLIHACKKLRLGMTKMEVELELTPESECLKGLKELSDG